MPRSQSRPIIALLLGATLALGAIPASASTSQKLSSSDLSALTSVPYSAFSRVGVTASTSVYAPVVAKSQPALKIGASGLPQVLYVGGEFCPYCAAERWPLVVALSRFGSFKNLKTMSSASTDIYPSTQTISFYGSSYSSKYLSFTPVEVYANYLNKQKTSWAKLQTLPKPAATAMEIYDSSKYFPGVPSGAPPIPFLDLNNTYLVVGSSFSPQVLHGLTRHQIITSLAHPKTPAATAIIATANYLTAGLCQMTKNRPAKVCDSAPVRIADLALKIKR